MRFLKLSFFFFVILTLTGCAHTSKKESWALNFAENDPAPCCDVIVDRLLLEYPPAQTTLYLSKSDNINFDTLLETKIRKVGYKISQNKNVVKISYVIDTMDENKNRAYLHLKSSEGLIFNRMFRLPNCYFHSNYTEQKSTEVKK